MYPRTLVRLSARPVSALAPLLLAALLPAQLELRFSIPGSGFPLGRRSSSNALFPIRLFMAT